MSEAPRFGFVNLLLFLVVLAAAATARGWYLYSECGNWASEPGPVEVQGQTDPNREVLVKNLSENNSFRGRAPLSEEERETAYTSPGYPVLLALLHRAPRVLSSVDQEARWLQCLLGTLTAGLYFLFARRAFQHLLVATVAGLLCAVYPFWIINTAEVSDGVLATFLLAACLFLGARGGQSGGPLTSLVYGLLLAGLALVRAPLLPFAFAAVLWFLLRCRRLKGGWLAGTLAFLGFLIGLAPWTVRNFQVLGDVVPIVDSAHLHLWMGNNPLATGGPQTDAVMKTALVQVRGEEGEARKNEPPTPRELDQATWTEVRTSLAVTLQRRLQAGLDFLFGADWFETKQLWRGSVSPGVAALLNGTLLGLLLLGFVGWRWTYAWRHEAKPSSLAVIWIPLPYLLAHAEALQGPRLPLDGVLLSYAAFALVCLLPVGRSLFGGSKK
jgi:hypothetical protein